MTSVHATSPSSPFSLNGNGFATSPSRKNIASSWRKDNNHGMHGGIALSTPMHLTRGHDSSDIAALSASFDDNFNLSRSLKGTADSPMFAMVQDTVNAEEHERLSHHNYAASEEGDHTGPFEGPEKLLELWFAESQEDVIGGGLLNVDRQVWENMLDIVKCKVLSVAKGKGVDAYLLSESSMFIFAHKLILKTCGTTTLLLGLKRILQIAFDTLKAADDPTPAEGLPHSELGSIVKRCFYSRKSFMFPERQKGPHRDWLLEVGLLDNFFLTGAAYTVGKMNGNHWLLYMTAPHQHQPSEMRIARPLRLPSPTRPCTQDDETLEMLMTHLSPASCARFEFPASTPTPELTKDLQAIDKDRGHLLGAKLSVELGLTSLFERTTLDGFAFEPCGYSANAIVARPQGSQCEDGYWTIHVTPEADSSYASFETNMATCSSGKGLAWLIARVLHIFEPGRLSVTLFNSTTKLDTDDEGIEAHKGEDLVTIIAKQDQGDILHALQIKDYKRTDRIAYEFEDYDLVFVSFDKIGIDLPKH
jgi:S-adenosylmethionine decarboxylase